MLWRIWQRKREKRDSLPPRCFLYLLDRFTREDGQKLEGMETAITELENDLLTSTAKGDYVKRIVEFRRRLLTLKRYYEQLVALFDELEEEDSPLMPDSEDRYVKNLAKRIDRLHAAVLNLRDYVTQVREAYQSQEDIRLNVIMKVFTVITTICLPLTLIAGWYGMNFNMPEYTWSFGYPLIIGVAVLMVVVCVWWFRKNDWF
ncbi:hypothetical protein LJC20_05735 [Eubacteriales bacterium OttesenSCG-928-M02]|nr:hypothetical protein [Eubacteriales bacterium OttesenSCG-928-M02]